jgi:hypothetical protein
MVSLYVLIACLCLRYHTPIGRLAAGVLRISRHQSLADCYGDVPT